MRSLEIQQQELLLELLLVQLREHSAVCLVLAMATLLHLHQRMIMRLLHRHLWCIINHLQYIMLHHRYIMHRHRTGDIGADGSAMMARFLLTAQNVS